MVLLVGEIVENHCLTFFKVCLFNEGWATLSEPSQSCGTMKLMSPKQNKCPIDLLYRQVLLYILYNTMQYLFLYTSFLTKYLI